MEAGEEERYHLQKVDTIVHGDTIFKIACPDCFEVRKDLYAGDSSLVLMHKERDDMYMIAYVYENLRNWNFQEAADTLSLIRNTQEGDTFTHSVSSTHTI